MFEEIKDIKINFWKLKFLYKFHKYSLTHKNNLLTALFWNRVALLLCPKWIDLWMVRMELFLENGKNLKAAKLYYNSIKLSPQYSTVHRLGALIANDGKLSDPFHTSFVDQIEIKELKKMVKVLSKSNVIYHPSRFWLYHLVLNSIQLKFCGFENFKQTANKNYFGWSSPEDIRTQFSCTIKALNINAKELQSLFNTISVPKNQMPEDLSDSDWEIYVKLLHLLNEYALRNDNEAIYRDAVEPTLGNPICIDIDGKSVSQDLPHTSIEINTFMPFVKKDTKKVVNVAELGAGCGRVGYQLLQAYNNIKYTIIDIPPALFISQEYLKTLFPHKKVFDAKEFSNWNEVKMDFEMSDIRFLYPQQLELMPNYYFDIFINISSMSEMRPDQINNWFRLIDQTTRGIFFFKQYKQNHNTFDEVVINKENYPIPKHWKILLDQENKLFSPFFDMVLEVN